MLHGTLSRYQRGCRCNACRDAKAAHWRRYARARARGDYNNGRVPTDDARAHIAALANSGMTLSEIAAQAGVAWAVVQRINAGTRRTGYARNINAILNVPHKRPVTGVGCTRRIQALYAMGWAPATIAATADIPPGTVSRLASGEYTGRLWRSTVTGVVRAYRHLTARTPPATRGGTQARDRAAREQWPAPGAWNDIDNPNEQPEPGVTPSKDAAA